MDLAPNPCNPWVMLNGSGKSLQRWASVEKLCFLLVLTVAYYNFFSSRAKSWTDTGIRGIIRGLGTDSDSTSIAIEYTNHITNEVLIVI